MQNIIGYATTTHIDSDGDMILKNSCTPHTKTIPILWRHDIAKVLGYVNGFQHTELGLIVKGKIRSFFAKNIDPTHHRFSVGIYVNDYYTQNNIRHIVTASITEVSIVPNPSNSNCAFAFV